MSSKVGDDDMTEENQRRASPELEAAANKAVHSEISSKALNEFSVQPGLVGLLARELKTARESLREAWGLLKESKEIAIEFERSVDLDERTLYLRLDAFLSRQGVEP
jgi:hypothetical protein